MFLGTCWLPSVSPQLMARCPITDSVLGGPHNAARATASSVPAWSMVSLLLSWKVNSKQGAPALPFSGHLFSGQ